MAMMAGWLASERIQLTRPRLAQILILVNMSYVSKQLAALQYCDGATVEVLIIRNYS